MLNQHNYRLYLKMALLAWNNTNIRQAAAPFMQLTEPIVFEPLFMERVWGGRRLESLFGKALPSGRPVGESWEIVDRENAQSIVRNGPLKGKCLHELWTEHRAEVFGESMPEIPRFPLLFKLLDARERLSVQVHPAARIAAELHGEPKTEMWFIVENDGDGEIFAGLRHGVTSEEFERALKAGTVEGKIHRVPVKSGDVIFIPSGRIHAIGAGNVIVEVQQNSDTTYRVFDWNRLGLDGRLREVHIAESLRAIDFEDFEPGLAESKGEVLVECDYFKVERWSLEDQREAAPKGSFALITCLEGCVECGGLEFKPGDFFLVPAAMEGRLLKPLTKDPSLLKTTIPQ
jgi:mannose-6-phosphate isomerase